MNGEPVLRSPAKDEPVLRSLAKDEQNFRTASLMGSMRFTQNNRPDQVEIILLKYGLGYPGFFFPCPGAFHQVPENSTQ